MKKIKLILIFMLFIFINIIIFNKQIAYFYSSSFILSTKENSADAVILLRGNSEPIALKAKDITAKKYFIIDSKRISKKYARLFLSEAQKKKSILKKFNIDSEILNKYSAVNRFDEALEVIEVLKKNKFGHIILVGATLTSKRTKLVFEHMLDKNGFYDTKIDFVTTTKIPIDWYKKESYLIAHLLEPFMWLFYLGMLNRY